jgi:hypothetical protein
MPVAARPWHRLYKESCPVTFRLVEDWVNDINVSGNYVANINRDDGSFSVYSVDAHLQGTVLWMKFIIHDTTYSLNRDHFYFKIYFHAGEADPCAGVELEAPTVDNQWWDCYEFVVGSDLVIPFGPAEATADGCGAISYNLSWERLPPNESEFSVDAVNNNIVGHPTIPFETSTGKQTIFLRAWMALASGAVVEAFSSPICLQLALPCA